MDKQQHNHLWADKLLQVSIPDSVEAWTAMEAVLERGMPRGWRDKRRWLLLILFLLLLIGVCNCPGSGRLFHGASVSRTEQVVAPPITHMPGGPATEDSTSEGTGTGSEGTGTGTSTRSALRRDPSTGRADTTRVVGGTPRVAACERTPAGGGGRPGQQQPRSPADGRGIRDGVRKDKMPSLIKDTVNTKAIHSFKGDTLYQKIRTAELRFLFDASYTWRHFIFGIRYNQALSKFINVQLTTGQTTQGRNTSLQLYLRYILRDSRKKMPKIPRGGK